MIVSDAAASFAIALMACGVLLTVMFFVAGALIVVGHFKPSPAMRRAGWVVLAVWAIPAATWTYYLQVVTEHDRYRTLTQPEVMYGVQLPAGAVVNFHRWARRVQWANLRTPAMIQGAEYIGQVNFCGERVCSGTLARDQEIEGLPCRAQTEINYSETTGHLAGCTLSRSAVIDGKPMQAGDQVVVTSKPAR